MIWSGLLQSGIFDETGGVTAGHAGSFNAGNPVWLTVQVILATISMDSVDFTDIGGVIGC